MKRNPIRKFSRESKPCGIFYLKFFKIIYREIVAAVARKAHNLEVGGSIPSLATKNGLTTVIKSRFPIF